MELNLFLPRLLRERFRETSGSAFEVELAQSGSRAPKQADAFLAEREEVVLPPAGEPAEQRLQVISVGHHREILEQKRDLKLPMLSGREEDREPFELIEPEERVGEKLRRRIEDLSGLGGTDPGLDQALFRRAKQVQEPDAVLLRLGAGPMGGKVQGHARSGLILFDERLQVGSRGQDHG